MEVQDESFVVDDEILAIQGLVDDMEWKKLDFDEVFTANSYAQAVNIMNKQEIDVLLCDIEMPLRSGVELVRWAKERNPELECIFLTCHAEFSFAKQAIQMGCLDYILKPAETEEVEECLRKAVKKIRKTREPASVKREKTEPSVSWTAEKIIGDSPKTKDAVELAEFYIIQHLTENLSLEEVAAEACVSPYASHPAVQEALSDGGSGFCYREKDGTGRRTHEAGKSDGELYRF